MAQWSQKYTAVLKALGDTNRLAILEMLSHGELCACRLLDSLDMSQPTLSHHMKLLCDSGIVVSRKEGKWVHYSINYEKAVELTRFFDSVATPSPLAPCAPCAYTAPDGGKTQLYVLTGFLGSGKTTILLQLLNLLQQQRVGVIQNEIGKLSIDGTILRNDHIKMVELNRGSIFCTCLKLSFVQALAEMAKQDLSYVFVESSGWGDPSNVEEIMAATRHLSGDQYDYKGVLCLVDAVNFFDQLATEETVYRQVKHCNMAVITKVDLIDGDTLDRIREEIRKINPVCKISLSSKGNLNLNFLQEDLIRYSWAASEDTTNSAKTKPKTLSLNFDGEMPKEELVGFLQEILPQAHRIKGFFFIKGEGWQQVDVVGSRIDFAPAQPQERSQLVFISKTGTEIIRHIFTAWENNTTLKMELKN